MAAQVSWEMEAWPASDGQHIMTTAAELATASPAAPASPEGHEPPDDELRGLGSPGSIP